jgi:hypothetical protein
VAWYLLPPGRAGGAEAAVEGRGGAGLLAGSCSRSQGEVFSLLDLFFPLLDLGPGSLARQILWMGRRVGVGDMVSGETLGRCWP